MGCELRTLGHGKKGGEIEPNFVRRKWGNSSVLENLCIFCHRRRRRIKEEEEEEEVEGGSFRAAHLTAREPRLSRCFWRYKIGQRYEYTIKITKTFILYLEVGNTRFLHNRLLVNLCPKDVGIPPPYFPMGSCLRKRE